MTIFLQRWRNLITPKEGRAWGKWIAPRYRGVSHIVWSMTPEAKPEFLPIMRELAAGLREGDGGTHLITFKPDPAPHPMGRFSNSVTQPLSTPVGWEDALLILEPQSP